MNKKVLIHFKRTLSNLNYLIESEHFFTDNDDELDVIVDDVPYEVVDGIYQDPDEQLCEHYGIDYDLVNCIEAM